MPTTDLHAQATTVLTTLKKLDGELNDLLTSIGGAVGSTMRDRMGDRLKVIATHLEPLLNLLGGGRTPIPAPVRRGPGRPRKVDGAAPSPAPKRRRRGGRGRRANLTIESITAALTKTGGNKSAAARELGVSQPTFYNYLNALGMGAKDRAKAAKKSKKR